MCWLAIWSAAVFGVTDQPYMAASGEGRSSLTQLTAATRDLLTQLERHLAAEEQVLAAARGRARRRVSARRAGGTSGIRSPRGRWSTWTRCLPGR